MENVCKSYTLFLVFYTSLYSHIKNNDLIKVLFFN